MPKPRAPPHAKLNVNYWQTFLRKKNLVGPFMETEQRTENLEVLRDPKFLNFLKIASQYGAPRSLEEFSSLNPQDKAYYLNAYKIYLEHELKKELLSELEKTRKKRKQR